MNIFLSWIESIATFFFLIWTLCSSLGYKRESCPPAVSIILFTGLFAVIYKPLEIASGNFYIYFTVMVLLASLYAYLFAAGHFLQSLTVCLTYIFCIVSVRSILFLPLEAAISSSSKNQIVMYFIFYLLLFLCSLFFQFHPLHTPADFPRKYWCCMILTPTLLSIFEGLYWQFNFSHFTYTPMVFSGFFLAFLAGLSIYYLSYIMTHTSYTLMESQLINQKLVAQLSNIERSASMIEQIQRDKHEMKNVYFYIQSLLKSGQIKELEDFVDTKLVHRFDFSENFCTGNRLLDYLLAQKVNEARDYNIHVITNIQIPDHLSIDGDDLCGLLLNLLDNAIDASKSEEPSWRDIHILIKKTKNFLEITVKNKISVNVLKTNRLLKTTKKDAQNHGFGMKIIDSITKKYNGIKNVEIKEDYFVICIILQLPS